MGFNSEFKGLIRANNYNFYSISFYGHLLTNIGQNANRSGNANSVFVL